MVTGDSQIRALIRLLSDEDDRIARTISGKLVEIGDSAIPLLIEAEIEQPDMARRIEGILDEIRGGRLEDEFKHIAALPDDYIDLEKNALLIARYAYPSLDTDAYIRKLEAMATEVRERMGRRVSGEEAVKTLNRYLFSEQGFRGNTKNYYEVDNSYLNRVIDRRMPRSSRDGPMRSRSVRPDCSLDRECPGHPGSREILSGPSWPN